MTKFQTPSLFKIIALYLLSSYFFEKFRSETINVLEYPVKKETNLFIEKELVPYLDTFLLESKYYNYSPSRVFYLDSIQYGVLPNGVAGATFLSIRRDTLYGKITISNEYSKDLVNSRQIFYHELGHWLGLEHEQNIIMIEGYDFTDTSWVNMFGRNWETLTYQYFKSLKAL